MTKRDLSFINKWAKKYDAVQYLGGECSKCGHTDFRTLNFHHVGHKTYNWIDLREKSWDDIKNEIDKCVLLCANCHGEEHWQDKNIKYDFQSTGKHLLLSVKEIYHCQRCGYNKYEGSLNFHHRDNKEFGLSEYVTKNKPKEIEDIQTYVLMELDKCEVICRNCHVVEHIDNIRLQDNMSTITNKRWRKNKKAPVNEILERHRKGFKNSEISKDLNVPKNTVSDVLRRSGLIRN